MHSVHPLITLWPNWSYIYCILRPIGIYIPGHQSLSRLVYEIVIVSWVFTREGRPSYLDRNILIDFLHWNIYV